MGAHIISVFLVCLSAVAYGTLENIYVNPVNNMFIDANGQTRMFHGVALDNNYGIPVMSDAQMQTMVDWGFNVVRLGFHWYLMEPSPGVWNQTYFNDIIAIVNQFESYGIYVILDMHQDCWAPMYCYAHGLPDFYAGPYNTSEYQPGGSREFPLPMAEPGPDQCADLSKGLFGWASCYLTFALSAGAQRLYDNDNNTLTAFGSFWTRVADQFSSQSNILAYEILNEPWLGDVFDDPDLLIPGQADKKNLARMNQAIHEAIRTVDNKHIIFYEPATGGNILDATPVGYTALPGGEEYQNRSGLAYHIYCPLLESDMPYHPTNHSVLTYLIEAVEFAACDLLNTYQYDTRANDVLRLHTAGFMTEFGEILSDENDYSMGYVQYTVNKMDEIFHSWTYWGLTPDPTSNQNLNKVLARTYARKISGIPSRMFFDHQSANFTLTFVTSVDSNVYALPTEVYTSTTYYYPKGSTCTVSPPLSVESIYNATTGVYLFTNNPGFQGQFITIEITPIL